MSVIRLGVEHTPGSSDLSTAPLRQAEKDLADVPFAPRKNPPGTLILTHNSDRARPVRGGHMHHDRAIDHNVFPTGMIMM